jgi:hypothetical protein
MANRYMMSHFSLGVLYASGGLKDAKVPKVGLKCQPIDPLLLAVVYRSKPTNRTAEEKTRGRQKIVSKREGMGMEAEMAAVESELEAALGGGACER